MADIGAIADARTPRGFPDANRANPIAASRLVRFMVRLRPFLSNVDRQMPGHTPAVILTDVSWMPESSHSIWTRIRGARHCFASYPHPSPGARACEVEGRFGRDPDPTGGKRPLVRARKDLRTFGTGIESPERLMAVVDEGLSGKPRLTP
jgi:hypothetical protein